MSIVYQMPSSHEEHDEIQQKVSILITRFDDGVVNLLVMIESNSDIEIMIQAAISVRNSAKTFYDYALEYKLDLKPHLGTLNRIQTNLERLERREIQTPKTPSTSPQLGKFWNIIKDVAALAANLVKIAQGFRIM